MSSASPAAAPPLCALSSCFVTHEVDLTHHQDATSKQVVELSLASVNLDPSTTYAASIRAVNSVGLSARKQQLRFAWDPTPVRGGAVALVTVRSTL